MRADRSHESSDTARYHGSGRHGGFPDHQGEWRFATAMSSDRQPETYSDLAPGGRSKHHPEERASRSKTKYVVNHWIYWWTHISETWSRKHKMLNKKRTKLYNIKEYFFIPINIKISKNRDAFCNMYIWNMKYWHWQEHRFFKAIIIELRDRIRE